MALTTKEHRKSVWSTTICSRFHAIRQSRGQQGIGITGVVGGVKDHWKPTRSSCKTLPSQLPEDHIADTSAGMTKSAGREVLAHDR